MVVAFYFRLHLAYFPRPVVAIFARPEQHRAKARCFHIFTATFQFKKLEKQDFSDNEFFSATGDILEMQQGIFMN